MTEAHLLWHQTLERYHDLDAFRANLNATIEALRNITFVLQSEKRSFAQFDAWYGPWQNQLKADPTSNWLHSARTTVVHQGELESYSNAEVRLVSWRDQVLVRVPVPAEAPSSLILQNLPLLDVLEKNQLADTELKSTAIAIERRWSTEGLGDAEVLEALAKVYGLISDLVLDAHVHLGQCDCIPSESEHPDFRAVNYLTGTLECMAIAPAARTQVFNFFTGEEVHPLETYRRFTFSPGDELNSSDTTHPTRFEMNAAKERYGFDEANLPAAWEALDPVRLAEKVLYQAKRILSRDKQHCRMMFFRDGRGKWHLKTLSARDRTEKHVLMRMAAQFIERKGCDALIEVAESWFLPAEIAPKRDTSDLQHVRGRQEALVVTVATREGVFRTYVTPFRRGPSGGIKFETTEETAGDVAYYMQPIFKVWRVQGYVRNLDGRIVPRLWEPDALEVCYCGGPNRFAECCKRRIPFSPDAREIRLELDKAKTTSHFDRAEELARAAVAQYVIWVKQHTAITVNAPQDLHRRLVDIDVLALQGYIELMRNSLEANGKEELFVPQLQYLAQIIGVPRLNMRLLALAARWLFETGRIEEAVLELDSLGSLDKIDDTLALLTAVELLDLPAERVKELLLRACSVAACPEEKWNAQLALVEGMLYKGENEKALAMVQSIISESSTDGSDTGVPTEALMLRWRMSKSQSDFESFRVAIDRETEIESRRHFAGILIDEGMCNAAEEILAEDVKAGDPTSKLLLTQGRIQLGNVESSRILFLTIERRQLSQQLEFPYAVALGHLALACKDEAFRREAISLLGVLRPLTGEMDQRVQNLLQALQGESFTTATLLPERAP